MNLQYTADLIADVLFRAGEPTDGTSQYAATALSYLNRAYLGIAAGGGELVDNIREDWWWLRKSPPGLLFLYPLIQPGMVSVVFGTAPATVTATIASNALTFSAAIGTSIAGWFIRIGTHPDIFRIATHTSGTNTATLDGQWSGLTGTTSYLTGKLEYDIASDVMRLLSPIRCFQKNTNTDPYKIHETDLEKLETDYPLAEASAGVPEVYARVALNKIRFNRFSSVTPDIYFRVEYDYLQRPTLLTAPGTTEEPLVPWEWRRVLSDWATFWLMVDKNDDRAEGVGQAAKSGLQAMANDNQDRLRNRSPLPYSPATPINEQLPVTARDVR